jgi:hypothetical protein
MKSLFEAAEKASRNRRYDWEVQMKEKSAGFADTREPLTRLKNPATIVVTCKPMESPFEAAVKKPAAILIACTRADICVEQLINIDIACKPMESPFEAAKKASQHRPTLLLRE